MLNELSFSGISLFKSIKDIASPIFIMTELNETVVYVKKEKKRKDIVL